MFLSARPRKLWLATYSQGCQRFGRGQPEYWWLSEQCWVGKEYGQGLELQSQQQVELRLGKSLSCRFAAWSCEPLRKADGIQIALELLKLASKGRGFAERPKGRKICYCLVNVWCCGVWDRPNVDVASLNGQLTDSPSKSLAGTQKCPRNA